MFSYEYFKIFMNRFFYRTPLVAASEKYEYTVYMPDLLKDCNNCFLLSLIEKHLNEPIIYYNFSFLIEKSFWNLLSLFHSLIAFEFVFILKHIFSINKLYVIFQSFFCIQLFSTFFMIQVFQGSGFSGSTFFRVHTQGLCPGFRSSPTLVGIFSYIGEEKWKNKSKVHKVHKIDH